MKTRLNKGFTLIELLVVIAIIGILSGVVLTSLGSARNKANTAATKSTLASLKAAIAMCCDNPTNTLNTAAGSEVCSAAIGSMLPNATSLKATGVTYAATGQCNATEPYYTVTLTGHPNTSCNGAILVGMASTTFPAGCN